MKFSVALSVLAISTVSAIAADLPAKTYTKAPVMAPAPVYNWTGFYGGLNAGGVWANTDVTYTASTFGFSGAAGAAILNAGTTGRLKSSGFTGGGQVGYNYQTGPMVLGIEADINYTGLSASRILPVNFLPIANVTDTFTESMQSNWLSTVRGRLGVAPGPWLLYATGGLAIAGVSFNDLGVFPASNSINSASSSQTRTGWTVGGGVEWMLSQAWSIKAEYLYVDLGSVTYTSINSVLNTPPNQATIVHDHHLTENIARVGFNYHLGAPVVANY